MRLELSTWPEVEAYLIRSKGIIIPIGSTEQHGPTGFIGTDALCPELITDRIAALTGALVAPTIPYGQAQHHMAFPGSVTLRPSTLLAVVRDVVTALAHHGFERFFFVNGHGGNIATVTAAFAEVYAEASLGGTTVPQGVRCRLENWWRTAAVKVLTDEHFGDGEGFHGTPGEISVTYHGYPTHAARVQVAPLNPKRAPTGPIYDAVDYRRRFPDGRIGSESGLATAAIGELLVEASAKELATAYEEFLAEP